MKTYNAYVRLGKGRTSRTLWIKGARWHGDSIVIDFDNEPCSLASELASGACRVAVFALGRSTNYVCTGLTEVEETCTCKISGALSENPEEVPCDD